MDKAPATFSQGAMKKSLWKFAGCVSVVLIVLCALKSGFSGEMIDVGSEEGLVTIQPIAEKAKPKPATTMSTVYGKNGSVYHIIDRSGGNHSVPIPVNRGDEVKLLNSIEALKGHSFLNATDNSSNHTTKLSIPMAGIVMGKNAVENAKHRTILAFGDSLTYGILPYNLCMNQYFCLYHPLTMPRSDF